MPTENRSSNTEMVSVPPYIGLEPLVGRYYPAKCRRCGWVGSSEELTEDDAQCTRHVGDRLCLGDCDELERHDLLNIIQAMARPAPQPHPEPIAWMVGTAFWWTKEEAERDAAATGLPIVGLGPMMGIAPAEQIQVEPVLWRYRKTPARSWFYTAHKRSAEIALRDGYIVEEFYTHADPGEVERIENERAEQWRLRRDAEADRDTKAAVIAELRAQLAERDVLLREAACHATRMEPMSASCLNRIDAVLDASAEPNALPDPLGCNDCAHADCGKFDGPRQVECRAMADNACARPGASS